MWSNPSVSLDHLLPSNFLLDCGHTQVVWLCCPSSYLRLTHTSIWFKEVSSLTNETGSIIVLGEVKNIGLQYTHKAFDLDCFRWFASLLFYFFSGALFPSNQQSLSCKWGHTNILQEIWNIRGPQRHKLDFVATRWQDIITNLKSHLYISRDLIQLSVVNKKKWENFKCFSCWK